MDSTCSVLFNNVVCSVGDRRHGVRGSSDRFVPPARDETRQGARTPRSVLPTEPAQPDEPHGYNLRLRHSHILPGTVFAIVIYFQVQSSP